MSDESKVGTVYFDDGSTVDISTESVINRITSNADEVFKALERSYSVEMGEHFPELVIKPPIGEVVPIPSIDESDEMLQLPADRYMILDSDGDTEGGLLLTRDAEKIRSAGFEPIPLVFEWLKGEVFYAASRDGNDVESFVYVIDVIRGLFLLAGMKPFVEDAQRDKPRKPQADRSSILISNTKIDKATFNESSKDHIKATEYDGSPHTVKTGKEIFGQLSLMLPEFDSMTMAERAENQLTERERFWLTAIQSLAYTNQDETRIYGSDMLKLWGWKKPTQEGSTEVMADAANAVMRMTQVLMTIDTTGEERAYKKRGKVVKSIQFRPVVDGLVSIVEAEGSDGDKVRDFYVDLRPNQGEPVTNALPTFEYALQKGQVITADPDIFDFNTDVEEGHGKSLKVRGLSFDHRRMMWYIYSRISERNTSNTIKYATMFSTLGIEYSKDKKSRAHKKICECLENWRGRGIIKLWNENYVGRRLEGVSVVPIKKASARLPKPPKKGKSA